jgi:hypothetical protein
VRHVELQQIRATSPTLAEVMRSCLLRAGLSRATGISDFVLGSPMGWLGIAYHEVLEKTPGIDLQAEPLDHAVSRLWADAVARQYDRAHQHPLDRRFGEPTTWPGYYLAEASVRLRARDIVTQLERGSHPVRDATDRPQDSSGPVRERQLVAFGGKLGGRPDVIRNGEIIDYKTGEIFELEGDAQPEVVKRAYVRQLRLYGYLVNDALGWWPRRGWLFPLAGLPVEVALEPTQCVTEATEAVGLLDRYNQMITHTTDPTEMASPSSEACGWCQFKSICPAFWQKAEATWSGHLDGAAVEGVLLETPRTVRDGQALGISVDIQAGSEARQGSQIAPLESGVYDVLAGMGAGDRIRIVGLRNRSDGRLLPGQRTVITPVSDLPVLTVAIPQEGASG